MIKYFYQTETGGSGPLSFHELWTAARAAKLRPHDSVRIEGLARLDSGRDRAGALRGTGAADRYGIDADGGGETLAQRPGHAGERLREAEEALRARNEMLQQAGLPPEFATPYTLAADYPGSEFELMQSARLRPAMPFEPRPYPLIEMGIALLLVLGTVVLLFAVGGMVYSLRQHGNASLPLFVMFLFVGLAGVFQLVSAAILAAYLDLLSDAKRSADAVAPPVKR
jgi:hypothetical protein